VGAAIFFIMALSLLPMAEVTAISFAAPLLVTVFSVPILGEIVGMRRWIAVAMGMAGVLMVIRPGTAFALSAMFPLFAAASWALSLVITRLMSVSDRSLVSLTYAALVGFAVSSALMPFVWVTPDLKGLVLGLGTGIFGTAAQYLTVEALRHERASVLAPFFYGSLVWSILLGYLMFGNLPDGWTYAGAAAIIASGLYTFHRERA
jgi:drug/metabolite transporter (DMT)-like permease